MPYDNRKTVTFANGKSIKLPPWCIREKSRAWELQLPTGKKLFAKWYVTVK